MPPKTDARTILDGPCDSGSVAFGVGHDSITSGGGRIPPGIVVNARRKVHARHRKWREIKEIKGPQEG